jgi:hypothetical protein
MREIDAMSEQEVITAALRNGTMDLEEAYGPDWDEKLVKISEQLKRARELGVPHVMIQSVSGQLMSQGEIKEDKDEKEV